MNPKAVLILKLILLHCKSFTTSRASNFEGLSCSFDTDLCGWRQSPHDSFDWTFKSGGTPSNGTGPHRDHTSGTGNYLYTETNYPRKEDDSAKLVFGPFSGSFCLSFFYHMHGPAIGRLNLIVDKDTVFSVTGEQGFHWIQAQVMVNGSDSELTFEGVVGSAAQGDISLDDVSATDYCNVSSCPATLNLDNGSVNCSLNDSIGSRCNLTCLAGYTLLGSSTRTCLNSGVWSGKLTSCVEIEVRLAGGKSSMQGRVEIAVNGNWGTICDDNWTLKSATVICRMLGLPPASAAPGDSGFGAGTGKIWLDKVSCSGTEASVIDCMHLGLGATRHCSHVEDAGVICGNISSFEVRLAGSSQSNQGRVEVSLNNVSGTICDDYWSIEDADVVCRMLGFPQATAATKGSSFGRGTGSIMMDDVKCVGDETSLLSCPRQEFGEKDCAHLEDSGVVCGPPTVEAQNIALGKPVSQSHPSVRGRASFAVDELFSTCTIFQTATNPWIRVDLVENYYIHTIHVLLAAGSCNDIDLQVGIYSKIGVPNNQQKCLQPHILQKKHFHVFHCRPPVSGRHVAVNVTGENVPLVLCGLAVYGFKSLNESTGILRQVWFDTISVQDDPILKYNPAFAKPADTLSILHGFHVASEFATPYGQRLSGYMQPPTTGWYIFYITCEDECELWLEETQETGLTSGNDKNDGLFLLKLSTRTNEHVWDEKPEKQESRLVFLSSCMFYRLEGFAREAYRRGHVSVGWRLPDNALERPFNGNRSYWVLPGERFLMFELREEVKDLSISFGSPIFVSASYKFCCNGMYCPSCPLQLELFILGRNHSIDSFLEMTCEEKQYNLTLNAAVEPGRYVTEVRYSFVNDPNVTERTRHLGYITVNVSVVQECNFDGLAGLCPKWKTGRREPADFRDDWEFSIQKEKIYRKGRDQFAYIDGARQATLQTPAIRWNSFSSFIRLCLRFRYSMRSQSGSELNVRLKSMHDGNETFLFHLNGFHGTEWLEGQVSWNLTRDSQIIFEGSSETNETFAVGIDNVRVTTEDCELNPLFSSPGHECNSDEFKCDNSECVKFSMRCDGDETCLDGSDEGGCTCLSDQFECFSGGCVAVTALCNGHNDCEDGSDEFNCGMQCPNFQCVDGSCIPWSLTCTVKERYCRDDTNSPRICGFGECPMNKLDCIIKRSIEPQCNSFQGHCSFENGFCGLTSDEDIEHFSWRTGSGRTPSENTGPSYDHSTLTEQGSYIFIEASQRKSGDRARLVSDWLKPNKSVCLQFWYHMYGRHIGKLNVYLKTNSSEESVWSQNGNQGDHWIFAQVSIVKTVEYKFVLEGVVGDDLEGDIAVDDLSVIDGTCPRIFRQVTCDCDFSEDICAWTGHPDWKVDPERFLYLYGGSELKRTLTSPPMNSSLTRCLRFWFRSGGKYFKRSLELFINSSHPENLNLIWSVNEETPKWTFIQLPLQSNTKTFQVVLVGSKRQNQATINIKEISFSMEECEKIAPPIECYDYDTLNTADRLVNHTGSGDICDDTLDFNRWYRIAGAAGTQIPDWSVPSRRCGARYPGWMNGRHPDVDEGVVTRAFCFVLGVDPCRWETTIKVRNCGEFYVYKLTAPSYCNQRYCGYDGKAGDEALSSVDEWWGWKNGNQSNIWQMKSARDIDELDKIIEEINWNDGDQEKLNNFEIHVKSHEIVSTNITWSAALTAVTFCTWVATKSCTVNIDYNVTTKDGMHRGFGLVIRRNLELIFMETITRQAMMSVDDGEWHHVCFTWTSTTGNWQTYKDGKHVDRNNEAVSLDSIPGHGKFSVKFWSTTQSPDITGKISSLNMWDYSMEDSEIIHMSYGCGDHNGNVLSWLKFGQAIRGIFHRQNPPSCRRHQGPQLITVSKTHADTGTAIYTSPMYNRSSTSYGKCLNFKYKMYGPGAMRLKIFQFVNEKYTRQPIWVDNQSKHNNWWYHGQVSIGTVSSFRIIIEGLVDGRPGYIAIGGLYMSHGYCQPQPLTSSKARNQNLTSGSGFILSPYYPGYYGNDITCKWLINAPEGHVIRLEFHSFAVEAHPKCSNDYVMVRDGESHASNIIGRYCGYTFPPVLESTSNALTVIFSSNSKYIMTGFKAYYQTSLGKRASCINECPSGTTCLRLPGRGCWVQVKSDSLKSLPGYFPETTAIILFQRNKIFRVRKADFPSLLHLTYLDLSNNVILDLDKASFAKLSNLQTLRLNGNFLKEVSTADFRGLHHLRTLDLGANLLRKINRGTFKHLKDLRVLSLRSNRIKTIEENTFQGLKNLTYLYLHDNNLNSINRLTFQGLASLETLLLHDNLLSEADVAPDAFDELKSLRTLTLDHFILCCYAKKSIPSLTCQSPVSAFSSCEDLMKSDGLRMCIWILGVVAFMGNALVVIWRIRVREDNKVQSIMLINLACADFLMGVYLLIIAIKDFQWTGEYFKHDVKWRRSGLCQMAGALSVLSSEVSVFMLTVITADRLICIVFALRIRPLSRKSARILCACVWIAGMIIAFIPLTGISYFWDEKQQIGFFGRSPVCLPFQLSEKRAAGWEYSVTFFMAVNGTAFLFILAAYVAMFWTALRLVRSSRNNHLMKPETARATRLFCIVLTDFFCWMPVIILGILSLTGDFHDPNHLAYVWIAVFVLPVNSSINPILYTFSTFGVRRKIRAKVKMKFGKRREFEKASQSRELGTRISVVDTEQYETRETVQLPPSPTQKKLQILSQADGFSQDSSDGMFHFIARESGDREMLLKFFQTVRQSAFNNELEMLGRVSRNTDRDHVPSILWHAKANSLEIFSATTDVPRLDEDASVICFDYVPGIPLSIFMAQNCSMMSLGLVHCLAIDVIKTIECLHNDGIYHNDIAARNVLTMERPGIPPYKAMLMNFDKASLESSNADIQSFGELLKAMLQHCSDADDEIYALANACKADANGNSVTATEIRQQLEESWNLFYMETKL